MGWANFQICAACVTTCKAVTWHNRLAFGEYLREKNIRAGWPRIPEFTRACIPGVLQTAVPGTWRQVPEKNDFCTISCWGMNRARAARGRISGAWILERRLGVGGVLVLNLNLV